MLAKCIILDIKFRMNGTQERHVGKVIRIFCEGSLYHATYGNYNIYVTLTAMVPYS